MRDGYLLKKLNSDPENGIALLIKEYGGLVYSVVNGRLGSGEFCSEDIENCVSDVFSEFYMALPSYSPDKGSISGYLCVIARHNVLQERSGSATTSLVVIGSRSLATHSTVAKNDF